MDPTLPLRLRFDFVILLKDCKGAQGSLLEVTDSCDRFVGGSTCAMFLNYLVIWEVKGLTISLSFLVISRTES